MKKRPEINVIQCPSGFWAVMVDEKMYDAASPDLETANKIADSLRAPMMTADTATNGMISGQTGRDPAEQKIPFKCTLKSVDKRTSLSVE